MYKNLDKENMFNAIWEFPDNLSVAKKLGENTFLIKFNISFII